jgi:uncharacterized membrane protein
MIRVVTRWAQSALILATLALLVAALMPASVVPRTSFASLCHQIPARCFDTAWGHPMPLCCRCFGIYAGALLAVLARWTGGGFAIRRPVEIAALLVAIGSTLAKFAGIDSSNGARFIFGLCAGIALVTSCSGVWQFCHAAGWALRHLSAGSLPAFVRCADHNAAQSVGKRDER